MKDKTKQREYCDYSAYMLSSLIRRREISAVEALESALARITAVDGRPGGDSAVVSCRAHVGLLVPV